MRYDELDIGRGIAVLAMIFFHIWFDLFYFDVLQKPPILFAWLIAGSFIFISGTCLYISRFRGISFSYFVKRSAKLAVLATIITAITYFALGEGFIIFGILHFFAVAGILMYPLLRLDRKILTAIMLVVFTIPFIFSNASLYLLWLLPTSFHTFDYFPLLPWLGVYILGVIAATFFYERGKRKFKTPKIKSRTLELIGRNSLVIYFLHQPVILAILYLFGFTIW